MTGLILVVDDLLPNVKLLEAKLTSEYYDVVTAMDGHQAIEQAKKHHPDIILLDVMMPGIDGFEACRRMKADPDIAHIPVVMVTALSEPSDRVKGLEAGADDFLTKPINDTGLFARVKALIRIKVLLDELRLRDQTGTQMGVLGQDENSFTSDVSGASILVINDDIVEAKQITERLSQNYKVDLVDGPEEAQEELQEKGFDLIIVSGQMTESDPLRFTSQLRSKEETRHVPILLLVDEDDDRLLHKGLEMGVNDYLITPIDQNEMVARVKTQLRRKRYQDALKSNYKQSVSMAITDNLTKLYNRHYLDAHLQNMVTKAIERKKPLSLIIMDMDHFKHVNDTYGHDVGDEVLVQLGQLIVNCIRGADLAVRFGGEEFVVVMPETDSPECMIVAERIRSAVENTPFQVSHEIGTLNKTVSIGVSYLNIETGDTPQELLKRADEALYAAKHGGRNRIVTQGETAGSAGSQQPPVQAGTPEQPAPPPPASPSSQPAADAASESPQAPQPQPTEPPQPTASPPPPPATSEETTAPSPEPAASPEPAPQPAPPPPPPPSGAGEELTPFGQPVSPAGFSSQPPPPPATDSPATPQEPVTPPPTFQPEPQETSEPVRETEAQQPVPPPEPPSPPPPSIPPMPEPPQPEEPTMPPPPPETPPPEPPQVVEPPPEPAASAAPAGPEPFTAPQVEEEEEDSGNGELSKPPPNPFARSNRQ